MREGEGLEGMAGLALRPWRRRGLPGKQLQALRHPAGASRHGSQVHSHLVNLAQAKQANHGSQPRCSAGKPARAASPRGTSLCRKARRRGAPQGGGKDPGPRDRVARFGSRGATAVVSGLGLWCRIRPNGRRNARLPSLSRREVQARIGAAGTICPSDLPYRFAFAETSNLNWYFLNHCPMHWTPKTARFCRVQAVLLCPGAGSAKWLPEAMRPPDSKPRDGSPSPHDGFRHRHEAHRYPSQHHRACTGRGYGNSQP